MNILCVKLQTITWLVHMFLYVDLKAFVVPFQLKHDIFKICFLLKIRKGNQTKDQFSWDSCFCSRFTLNAFHKTSIWYLKWILFIRNIWLNNISIEIKSFVIALCSNYFWCKFGYKWDYNVPFHTSYSLST